MRCRYYEGKLTFFHLILPIASSHIIHCISLFRIHHTVETVLPVAKTCAFAVWHSLGKSQSSGPLSCILPAWLRWRATPPLLTAGSLILISIRTAFCFEGSLFCSQVSKGNKLMGILTSTASFSYIMWPTGLDQVHPQILWLSVSEIQSLPPNQGWRSSRRWSCIILQNLPPLLTLILFLSVSIYSHIFFLLVSLWLWFVQTLFPPSKNFLLYHFLVLIYLLFISSHSSQRSLTHFHLLFFHYPKVILFSFPSLLYYVPSRPKVGASQVAQW